MVRLFATQTVRKNVLLLIGASKSRFTVINYGRAKNALLKVHEPLLISEGTKWNEGGEILFFIVVNYLFFVVDITHQKFKLKIIFYHTLS